MAKASAVLSNAFGDLLTHLCAHVSGSQKRCLMLLPGGTGTSLRLASLLLEVTGEGHGLLRPGPVTY